MKAKTPSESQTITTQIILPNDANPMGIVQGGRIVQLMDITAAICAQAHSGKIAVTASIDKVCFLQPAKVGDIVTIKANVTRVFTTSMEIFTEVTIRSIPEMEPVISNTAYFTFVALGADQLPTAIPKILPQSSIEKMHYKEALRRKKQWKSGSAIKN
jgi:acyl-CoA hydrolase